MNLKLYGYHYNNLSDPPNNEFGLIDFHIRIKRNNSVHTIGSGFDIFRLKYIQLPESK